jgi:hypothetical protein
MSHVEARPSFRVSANSIGGLLVRHSYRYWVDAAISLDFNGCSAIFGGLNEKFDDVECLCWLTKDISCGCGCVVSK